MALVVGYDLHPASRAALIFAGDLAGALNVPVHVVHVLDVSDSPIAATPASSADTTERNLDAERRHVADTLGAAHVQWTYHLLNGDPVATLLAAADEHGASMIVVGRPEQGIGATLGHIVTGTVARTLLRRSHRPVVVVPEFAGGPR